ncbi:MAG: hypothetical protein AB7N24_15480 [Dehalococcoidia bacterium]
MRPLNMNERESPAAQDSVPELIYRYEDGYDAEIHPTFESLSRQFAEYAEGPFAAYNVPIWVEYERDCGDPAVSIGVVLTRHGLCMIWRSPATPAQFREIQRRTLSVWASRADVGFGRFIVRFPDDPDAETDSR